MKLSSRARYGLQSMMAIYRETEFGTISVSLGRGAVWTDFSKKYFEQIAIALKSPHVIRGASGGGYLPYRPADETTLRQIVEDTLGPINIVDCICDPDRRISADHYELQLIYLLINQRITGVLDPFRLVDLSDRAPLASIVESFNKDRASNLKIVPRPGETLRGCRLHHAPETSVR